FFDDSVEADGERARIGDRDKDDRRLAWIHGLVEDRRAIAAARWIGLHGVAQDRGQRSPSPFEARVRSQADRASHRDTEHPETQRVEPAADTAMSVELDCG